MNQHFIEHDYFLDCLSPENEEVIFLCAFPCIHHIIKHSQEKRELQ